MKLLELDSLSLQWIVWVFLCCNEHVSPGGGGNKS